MDYLTRHFKDYERFEIYEDGGLYISDSFENTFLSVIVKQDYSEVYFGTLTPKVSIYRIIESIDPCDILYYLEDNLENMADELNQKFLEK